MLRRVGFLENIIESKVNELMLAGNIDAKEIYSACKETIETISKMLPYSGTIYLPVTTIKQLEDNKHVSDDLIINKEIYQDVKNKVQQFAELHGQSEIITKQLEG